MTRPVPAWRKRFTAVGSAAALCLVLSAGLAGGTAGATSLTWQVVLSESQTLGGISCPTSTECFVAAGSVVWTTDNAGATWASQSLPSGITGVYNVSCASTSACVADGASSSEANFGPEVVTTMNGGQTWTVRSSPPSDIGLTAISCATGTTDCQVIIGYNGNGKDSLIVTTNGGVT